MQIYDHDSLEAIAFKSNITELETWIAHLNYIDKEVKNLLNLSKAELSKTFEFQPVILKLQHRKEENKITLNGLIKYRESLSQAAECEDVSCDMYYVNEHERYRKVYMYHLEKYRRVKEEYFSILSK